MASVTIPNSVTYIGESAFFNCGLTSINIPNSVSSIIANTFMDCRNLKSVTIPNSITKIGSLAFRGCRSLRSVYISDIAAWSKTIFVDPESNPLYYAILYLNGSEVNNLVIPNSVTSIGDYAFSGYNGLKSVIIPNSVTTIGQGAFNNCI